MAEPVGEQAKGKGKHREVRTVLRIDSSARKADSVSRQIGDEVLRRLGEYSHRLRVRNWDLGDGMEHIDEHWVAANFTPADARTPAQRDRLAVSDAAVEALQEADVLVLTVPVYNFSIPSALKAWVDHICRAGLTFRYTEDGPEGLLHDRPVYLVMASGGVPFGGPTDFASTYLKQVLQFVGIRDVRLIGAEGVAGDAHAARLGAMNSLEQWLPGGIGRVA